MTKTAENAQSVAAIFNSARVARHAIAEFPGPLPDSADASYAIQEQQIILRQEPVVGWKVAMTAPAFRDSFGAERLVGPVFTSRQFFLASGELMTWAVIPDGFAAVEAEFIAVLGSDVPDVDRALTVDDIGPCIGSWHAGMEFAGSPLATINDLGPFAVAADCGNNDGVVVGPEIPDWQGRGLNHLTVTVSADGALLGSGLAGNIKGGPLAAVAFLASHLAARGQRLRAGQCVSTGALTGVHRVRRGQAVQTRFGDAMTMDVLIR